MGRCTSFRQLSRSPSADRNSNGKVSVSISRVMRSRSGLFIVQLHFQVVINRTAHHHGDLGVTL
jgi:hypothetical protein